MILEKIGINLLSDFFVSLKVFLSQKSRVSGEIIIDV